MMHMKNYLSLLLILLMKMSYTQIDTTYWGNGKIIGIEKYDKNKQTLFIQEFDSIGNKKYEGTYKFVDSIQSVKSINNYNGINYLKDIGNIWYKNNSYTAIKIGVWKFYQDGYLIKEVEYEPIIFQYSSVSCDKLYKDNPMKPCPASYSFEFLISSIKYLRNNKVHCVEWYNNGLLESRVTYLE
jgi:hypothetical protein